MDDRIKVIFCTYGYLYIIYNSISRIEKDIDYLKDYYIINIDKNFFITLFCLSMNILCISYSSAMIINYLLELFIWIYSFIL